VTKTIGVSKTTVASRLRTAVTADPTRNTTASSATGRPREAAAIHVPAAAKSPSRSAIPASTNTAARNPSVGPRLRASSAATCRGRMASASTRAAAGTETTASGRPHGRTTATTSVAPSRTIARTSPGAPDTSFSDSPVRRRLSLARRGRVGGGAHHSNGRRDGPRSATARRCGWPERFDLRTGGRLVVGREPRPGGPVGDISSCRSVEVRSPGQDDLPSGVGLRWRSRVAEPMRPPPCSH